MMVPVTPQQQLLKQAELQDTPKTVEHQETIPTKRITQKGKIPIGK